MTRADRGDSPEMSFPVFHSSITLPSGVTRSDRSLSREGLFFRAQLGQSSTRKPRGGEKSLMGYAFA